MAKRQDNGENLEIAENVSVHTSRDGVLVPTSTDSSIMRELTDDVLRRIGETGNAFDDAVAIATQQYGELKEFADEMGTGFQLTQDKSMLVGKKFLALKWNFNSQGDYGVFVSVACVTADGGKYIINDGSTGICAQLLEYSTKSGRFGGILAPRGLRESSYATCKACGQPRTAFDETCENTMSNGSVCGNTDTDRGTGATYYVDLSA